MTARDLFYILIALGIIWTIIWLRIVTSVPHVKREAEVDENTDTLRRRLFFPLSAALLIGIALSLYFMPYPSVRSRTIGEPTVTVHVTAVQWGWTLEKEELPVGTPIQFDLETKDVNHGFAIYDPDGVLVTQAQVMPGYINELIYKFDKPGTYTVRCLEYCGLFHHIMTKEFTVA